MARARHNEDRFFKYSMMIAVPVLVVSLLAIVLYLTNSDDERHPTAQNSATNTVTPVSKGSPTIPRTEPASESSPIPVESPKAETEKPALSADEIRQLTKERQDAADMVTAIEGILGASSVTERVEIYCRFTVDKAQALFAPNVSGVNKQQQDFNHDANINRCKGMILIGYQTMPDLDEFREKASRAREHIAEIDQKLATQK